MLIGPLWARFCLLVGALMLLWSGTTMLTTGLLAK